MADEMDEFNDEAKGGVPGMENCRTNEVLSEQIATIQEFALKLNTNDLRQLGVNLSEIEVALNKLKEFMAYLPR